MPSPWHDSVTRLIEDDPKLAVTIVRDLMGEPLPLDLAAALAPPGFNDRPSTDFTCDAVVVAGPARDPVRGIIVEAQQAQSAAKRVRLAKYAAELWVLLGCPVDVVVICPDLATAAYYATPVETSLPGYVFTARPLYSSQVPVITDAGQLAAYPAQAALVVAFHGDQPGVIPAFVDAMTRLGEDGHAYTEIGYCLSPLQVQRLLEEAMAASTTPIYTPWSKKAYAEGEADGERDAVLLILKARALAITDEQRRRIQSCTDLSQLKSWVERAATASTTDELFA